MFSFPESSSIDGILLGISQGRFVFFSNRLVPLNRSSRRAAESWLDWTGFEEAGRRVDMELPFGLPRNRWEHCFESQSFSFSLAMRESNTFETTKIGTGSSTPGLYYVPVILSNI